MQRPTALILAGGFATRLWPLTERRAKPLLPLAGKPLIQHLIEAIPRDLRIILSTNQVFEKDFCSLIKGFPKRQIEVFVEDSTKDQGKVGALAATALAIKAYEIKTPLLLMAGDNYFGFRMEDFLEAYSGKTLIASFDTRSLEQARQFGVLEVNGKRLYSFVEKPTDPRSTLVSTGCYLFCPEDLAEIQKASAQSADHLGAVFEHLLRKGVAIDVFSFPEPWIDIGSFESYLSAHRLLLSGQRISDLSSVNGSRIGASVEIGDDCRIENSELEESLIMGGTTIRNARLRGCIVDHDCLLENVDLDHKMIRAGTTIRGRITDKMV